MSISFKDLSSSIRSQIEIACLAAHKKIPNTVFVETKYINGINIVTYTY